MAERRGKNLAGVGKVRLVVERGESAQDTAGKVASVQEFRSVRGARDRLYELREEWEGQGWVGDNNLTVFWQGEKWLQGLVVDERGERL